MVLPKPTTSIKMADAVNIGKNSFKFFQKAVIVLIGEKFCWHYSKWQ